MKVHFATAEGTHAYIQKYTFPQVFDIKEDPKESYELWGNEGYIHAWVMGPVTNILTDLATSMKQFPNIKPGQNFGGYKNTTAPASKKKASLEDAKTINLRLTVDC